MNRLLQKLKDVIGQEDPIPKGFRSIEDWGKKWGMQRSQTQVLLRSGEAAGLMRSISVRVRTRASSGMYLIRRKTLFGEVKK